MTISLQCTHCGRDMELADRLAGLSIRCPSCRAVLPVPHPDRAAGITSERASPPRATSRPSPRPRPKKTGGATAALVLGIVALVLGVPALLLSWVPLIGVVSLVAAGIGIILAAVGVLMGILYRGPGLGLAIGGGAVNLLALLVAGTVTLFVGGLLGPVSPPVVMEAEPASDLPGWGQVYNPDGDCTIEVQPGGLSIRVPPTAHDLSAEIGQLNAPRVLTEVEGDFTVRVKVCGSIQPTADAAVVGRVPFQSAGLLLYSDTSSYIRLERAALRRGVIRSYAAYEQRSHGQVLPPPAAPNLPDEDVELRLERRGNQVLGSAVLANGREVPLPPMTIDYPSRVRVGVAAVNAAQQPLNVRFEGFRIDRK